jgi:hypothetical protein
MPFTHFPARAGEYGEQHAVVFSAQGYEVVPHIWPLLPSADQSGELVQLSPLAFEVRLLAFVFTKHGSPHFPKPQGQLRPSALPPVVSAKLIANQAPLGHQSPDNGLGAVLGDASRNNDVRKLGVGHASLIAFTYTGYNYMIIS